MCNHPWYHGLGKDYALCLILKHQLPFSALMKPKPQNVAKSPRKEMSLILFFFPDASFCLTRAQHQQWVLLHLQPVRNKIKMGTNIDEKESSCKLHHGRAPQKVSEATRQCNAIGTSIYRERANNIVHKNRIKRAKMMIDGKIQYSQCPVLTFHFIISYLFILCYLELNLPNNNQRPWGVCCYP